MKLCFLHKRWILLFCCLIEIFRCVGISSTSAQKMLNGVVGESITFPTHVSGSGTLIFDVKIIGQVFNSQAKSFREFKDRLHWNSGFFTLSQLRINDSGLYTVDNTEEDRKYLYYVEVYHKVSKPEVRAQSSSSSESDLCLLVCSVKNVRGLNLIWFKGSVILNHTNSSSPEDTLNLPLETQPLDKDTLSCVASNPVSKQTTTVNFTELCIRNQDVTYERVNIIGIVLSVIFVMAIIVMAIYISRRKKHTMIQRSEDSFATEGQQEEVQYSVVAHKKHNQGNIYECASPETSLLTTVYDQIRPHQPGTSAQSEST